MLCEVVKSDKSLDLVKFSVFYVEWDLVEINRVMGAN